MSKIINLSELLTYPRAVFSDTFNLFVLLSDHKKLQICVEAHHYYFVNLSIQAKIKNASLLFLQHDRLDLAESHQG